MIDSHDADRAKGYSICTLAAESKKFVVMGVGGGDLTDGVEVETDARARAVALERWPGCTFAITTMRALFGEGAPDLVVMTVVRGSEGRQPVIGWILGEVHGPHCIPFTPSVWPDVIDKLPAAVRVT